MADARKVRVILRWVQIKDNLEPFFKEHGEFFFTTKVTSGSQVRETRLPEKGHWEISDHPRFSKVDKIDTVLFEGAAGDRLVVELFGQEIDQLSANDHLDPYRKEFIGSPESWVGRYAPGDEGSTDPENMRNWRICYDVELV
jgi:hypothetical protein